MAKVIKKPGESAESLIKRFKKQVVKDGILMDVKKKSYYLSPAQKKREKHKLALKRMKKRK